MGTKLSRLKNPLSKQGLAFEIDGPLGSDPHSLYFLILCVFIPFVVIQYILIFPGPNSNHR